MVISYRYKIYFKSRGDGELKKMFFLKSKLDALIMKYVFSKSEVETKKHFQHIVLFELYRVKALDAARAICVLYEEDTIGESTVRK